MHKAAPAFTIRNEQNEADIVFDAASITALIPQRHHTLIYQGDKPVIEVHWEECDSMMAKLAACGHFLHAIPMRGLDQDKAVISEIQEHAYAHSDAINFITYAEPRPDGYCVAMIGIGGRRISTFLTQDEIAALAKQRDDFLFMPPQDAYARCSDPAGLYIAAGNITEVCVDAGGLGINVIFGNRIDVLNVNISDRDDTREENRDNAARKIAAAATGLREVPHSRRLCFLTPEHVDYTLVPDDATYPDGSHPYTLHPVRHKDQLILEFVDKALRRKALEAFAGKSAPVLSQPTVPQPRRSHRRYKF